MATVLHRFRIMATVVIFRLGLAVLRLYPCCAFILAMNRNRSRSLHRHASPTQRRLAKHVSSMCRACVEHVSGMCPPMHMEARPAGREDTVR